MYSPADVPPLARGLLVGTAVIWVLVELRQAFKHRPEGVKANWTSEFVFRISVLVGVLVAIGVARVAPGAIRPLAVASWIGLALLWSGIALRFWSFRTLGRYFTFVIQTSGDQPVINDGPYRVIRHPSYTAILLAVMGIGLFIGNWLSLLSLAVVIACGLVYRIRVEERALLQNLVGYRKYAATHKRLVPFIW